MARHPRETHDLHENTIAGAIAMFSRREDGRTMTRMDHIRAEAEARGTHVNNVVAEHLLADAGPDAGRIPRLSSYPARVTPGSVDGAPPVVQREDGYVARVDLSKSDEERAASAAENDPGITPGEAEQRRKNKKNQQIPGAIGSARGGVRRETNIAPYVPGGGVAETREEEEPPAATTAPVGDLRRRRNTTKAERKAHADAAKVAKKAGTAGEKAITEKTPVDDTGGASVGALSLSRGYNGGVPTRSSLEEHEATGGEAPVREATPGPAPVRGSTLRVDHLSRPASSDTQLFPSKTPDRPKTFEEFSEKLPEGVSTTRARTQYAAHVIAHYAVAGARQAVANPRYQEAVHDQLIESREAAWRAGQGQ
jgi:hypothetical protein